MRVLNVVSFNKYKNKESRVLNVSFKKFKNKESIDNVVKKNDAFLKR